MIPRFMAVLSVCVVVAAAWSMPAFAAGSAATRTAKIETQIKQLKKQEWKYQGTIRFWNNSERRWILHPRQMGVPCWEAKLHGPLGLCMKARADVRVSTKKLRFIQQKISSLQVLMLPVGNVSHWNCIYRYERHPRQGWRTKTGNGFYGGLQMNLQFQRTYGPRVLGFRSAEQMFRVKGTADQWLPREQMAVAENARRSGRGYYPWPNTARYCGLI